MGGNSGFKRRRDDYIPFIFYLTKPRLQLRSSIRVQ
jgi:hypothetical protein